MKEREEAKLLFKSKKGKEIQKELAKKAKTFTPGANLNEIKKGPNEIDLKRIREAITNASSLEEVERLHLQIQAGQIPGQENVPTNGETNDGKKFFILFLNFQFRQILSLLKSMFYRKLIYQKSIYRKTIYRNQIYRKEIY